MRSGWWRGASKIKGLSEQQLKEYLEEHYHYEIAMLAFSFQQLLENQRPPDQNKNNMAIECFLLHARNLYEFYYHSPNKDYSRATNFILDWDKYRPAKTTAIKEQENRINLELSHLTYKRIAGSTPEKQWNYGNLYNDYLIITKTFLEHLPKQYIGGKLARLKADLSKEAGRKDPAGNTIADLPTGTEINTITPSRVKISTASLSLGETISTFE